MEWFKHKTNAHDDPVVSDAWDEFGDAGYLIWFVLLELYGQNFKIKEPGRKLSVSKTFMRRKFRKSWGKVEQVLRFYSTMGKLSLETDEKTVTVEIPNFDVILSNWTKREVNKPTEAPTEAPTAKSKSKIKSKSNINNSKKIIFPDWLDMEVWQEYKNYRGNGKAKFTPYAQQLAIKKLEKLRDSGNDPSEVIKRSIECGWSGLFPLKENKQEETLDAWTKRVSQT